MVFVLKSSCLCMSIDVYDTALYMYSSHYWVNWTSLLGTSDAYWTALNSILLFQFLVIWSLRGNKLFFVCLIENRLKIDCLRFRKYSSITIKSKYFPKIPYLLCSHHHCANWNSFWSQLRIVLHQKRRHLDLSRENTKWVRYLIIFIIFSSF